MKKSLTALSALIFSLPAFSATPINLSSQPVSFLLNKTLALSGMAFFEKSRFTDFNNTLHIRLMQTYQGYPVWDGEGIVHIPKKGESKKAVMTLVDENTFMTGTFYKNLKQDLDNTPHYIFTDGHLQSAINHIVSLHQNQSKFPGEVKDKQGSLMIYIDDNHKAHWAFRINFYVEKRDQARPEQPTYIVDAANFTVYDHWDNIKSLVDVKAGGFAGNHKTGKKILDGLDGHYPSMDVSRDEVKNLCYMQNTHFTLLDRRYNYETMSFPCNKPDPEHNNVYWNGNHDMVETTWSPSNDVMYGLEVTIAMFNDWYHMPVLVEKDGKPLFIRAIVHDPMENAYWNGRYALFGDSVRSDVFNPFTQLDTVTHEICHGFTEQHSNLNYSRQPGGINEAFSDFAGMAAEYYAYGKTDLLIGVGDVKAAGKALRYMDKPSKDCNGKKPGDWCSIDHVDQYFDGLDPHFSSGIYNRVFYNLANSPNWNVKKALDVMVQANMSYWRETSTFAQAACGVKQAASDYRYEITAIDNAFKVVGIDTSKCSLIIKK